jgi:hypothetical protein
VVSPFGRLPIGIEAAIEISKVLPDSRLIQFVGLAEDLFLSYQNEQVLDPRHQERIGDVALIGKDGLMVASVNQIVEDGI